MSHKDKTPADEPLPAVGGRGLSEGLGAGAEARKLRRAKPWWRYTLRTSIDLAALYCAFAIQLAASGSYAAAFITAAAVGLYGCWCFFDGSA